MSRKRLPVVFSKQAEQDLLHWEKANKHQLIRINALIESMTVTPFEGIGRPKELKGDLQGAWSRRIDSKNRIVYEVYEGKLTIVSLRGHY